MQADIVLGAAMGYSWADLQPFAISLRRCGYQGRCILLIGQGHKVVPVRYGDEGFGTEHDLLTKLAQYDIEVHDLGEFDGHPMEVRHSVMAGVIEQNALRYVVCVDTKDVVFQSNPMVWLEQNLAENEIAVVAENTFYERPTPNAEDFIIGFGLNSFLLIKGQQVLNMGVVGGKPAAISSMLRQVYELTMTDPRTNHGRDDLLTDQSALNIVLRGPLFTGGKVKVCGYQDGFAFGHFLTQQSDFRDGLMYPKGSEVPYAVFHQYFNQQDWWKEVRRRYAE